ncbi:MAG: DUF3617 domain-containing protein [Alteraurantiacibacter sp.]
MRIHCLLATVPLLVLAACDDSVSVDDPSDPDQIADAADALAKPQPGQYRQTSELVEFSSPGASEEEQAMMDAMFRPGTKQTSEFCLTPEQAEEGYREFASAFDEIPDDCEFAKFDIVSGTLDAAMQCDDGSGNVGNITFGGEVSETSSDMTMTIDLTSETEGRGARMVIRNTSERIGECTGEEDAGPMPTTDG